MLDPRPSCYEGPVTLQHVVFEVGLRHRVERQGGPIGHRDDFERWVLSSAHVYDLYDRGPRRATTRSDVHTFALVGATVKSIFGAELTAIEPVTSGRMDR